MRSFASMVIAVVAVAGSAASASDVARARGDLTTALDDQLAIANSAHDMVAEKQATRADELHTRVRAAYKLFRAGWTPMWVDESERTAMVRRRAAARRILRRDVGELALLQAELVDADDARARLRRERTDADTIAMPERGSLARPVPGRVRERFGTYEHDSTGARLSRRGVEMLTRPGREVKAVADGTVRYCGEIANLGYALIVDHGDFVSVLARLRPLACAVGAQVARGAVVGRADGRRVYLEIRLPIGPGGHPIDPAQLLRSR